MKKINRRDYLLQMGAGAAGLIGVAESPLFGQAKKKSPNQKPVLSTAKEPAKENFLLWDVINDPPLVNAFVTVIYCGVVGFCYNKDEGFVDVRFHSGDDLHPHQLEIQIYKNPPNPPENCPVPYPPYPPPVNIDDEFRLEVPGQVGRTPVVFQMDGPFDRYRIGKGDDPVDHDFRWMPDLHSSDFYPEGYGLKAVTGPKLEVHNGTFYTRLRSNSTFSLVDARLADCDVEVRDFGHVALCMATAIDAQSDVLLFRNEDTEPYKFKWTAGDTYQIVFKNECVSCDELEPSECSEHKRNDFHFNREILKVPKGRMPYGLKLKNGCGANACAKRDFCIKTDRKRRASDEAPCMSSGYGKASGFP